MSVHMIELLIQFRWKFSLFSLLIDLISWFFISVDFFSLAGPISPGPYANGTPAAPDRSIYITYDDGAGSEYAVANGQPSTALAGSIISFNAPIATGTFSGTLTKMSGPGATTLLVTAGSFDVVF